MTTMPCRRAPRKWQTAVGEQGGGDRTLVAIVATGSRTRDRVPRGGHGRKICSCIVTNGRRILIACTPTPFSSLTSGPTGSEAVDELAVDGVDAEAWSECSCRATNSEREALSKLA